MNERADLVLPNDANMLELRVEHGQFVRAFDVCKIALKCDLAGKPFGLEADFFRNNVKQFVFQRLGRE